MTKLKEKKKIPKLRFPEFDGEWEEKRFGDVTLFWNGKAHEKDISENGKYIVVNSKFVSRNGKVKKYSNIQISPLKKDDIAIVMSDIPRGKAIGKCFLIDKNGKYTLNQRIGGLKSKNIISQFLIHIVNRNKYFLKFDNGVSQTNLRKDEILRCPIIYPQKEEQQKIADFLMVVDEKIDGLKKKKENLEKYKKGVMQKILTQEIRFKDENGKDFPAWEKKKLEEILKSIPTKKYQIKNSEILSEGKYKVVDQGQNIIAGYSNNKNKIFKNHTGVIIYGDHTTIVKFIDFDFIIGADGTKLLTGDSNSVKYLYYNLSYSNIKSEGYKRHYSILKKIHLNIPSPREQQKIASFLSSLDEKIENINHELIQSQKFKKGLLQELFV